MKDGIHFEKKDDGQDDKTDHFQPLFSCPVSTRKRTTTTTEREIVNQSVTEKREDKKDRHIQDRPRIQRRFTISSPKSSPSPGAAVFYSTRIFIAFCRLWSVQLLFHRPLLLYFSDHDVSTQRRATGRVISHDVMKTLS